MNRLIILGVLILGALYVVFSSIYVVNEREQAIVMRFGAITDVKKDPGLYFKIPTNVVDSVQIVEDRLLRYDIANMTLQVRGGKFYQGWRSPDSFAWIEQHFQKDVLRRMSRNCYYRRSSSTPELYNRHGDFRKCRTG